MNYNPNDKTEGGGRATAGRYRFKVDDAQETTFKSGNEGVQVTLLVGAFDSRDVKVFDRFVFLPNSLWKLEQFMQSIGLDFHDTSIKPGDMVGLAGEASFVVGEKGYLEPDTYLPAEAGNTAKPPAKRQPAPRQQVAATDDVPF